MKTSLPLGLGMAVLALAGCDQSEPNNAATAQPGEAQEAAGDQTVAASLDQNSRFFQAARAVGLDATLAGPGPYTVLVPGDEAFGQAQGSAISDPANPQNRGEITRVLTYHILPGVILAEDIGTAIDNGGGNAVLATMGGETLTATKDGDTIVLTDQGGGRATITEANVRASNGVIHRVSGILMPPQQAAGGGAGDEASNAATPAPEQ